MIPFYKSCAHKVPAVDLWTRPGRWNKTGDSSLIQDLRNICNKNSRTQKYFHKHFKFLSIHVHWNLRTLTLTGYVVISLNNKKNKQLELCKSLSTSLVGISNKHVEHGVDLSLSKSIKFHSPLPHEEQI